MDKPIYTPGTVWRAYSKYGGWFHFVIIGKGEKPDRKLCVLINDVSRSTIDYHATGEARWIKKREPQEFTHKHLKKYAVMLTPEQVAKHAQLTKDAVALLLFKDAEVEKYSKSDYKDESCLKEIGRLDDELYKKLIDLDNILPAETQKELMARR